MFCPFFGLTLTVTHSENGMVTRTSTNDTKVRNMAQRPGPSGSAEKEKNGNKKNGNACYILQTRTAYHIGFASLI